MVIDFQWMLRFAQLVCTKVAVSDRGDGFEKMGRQHGTWQMGMGEA
jgi:hypothetical protein